MSDKAKFQEALDKYKSQVEQLDEQYYQSLQTFQDEAAEVGLNREDIREYHRQVIKNDRAFPMKSTAEEKPESFFERHFGSVWSNITTAVILLVVVMFFGNPAASGIPKNIAGYIPMTVLTRSMQSTYPQNSFILAKETDPNDLNIGDDITFLKQNNTTITHRIVGIAENYEGTHKRAFETKGTDNQRKDDEMVYADNVVGKVIFHSLLLGRLLLFAKSNPLLIVAMLFLLNLLIELGVDIWRDRKKGKIQSET
jgi:signal peptidase